MSELLSVEGLSVHFKIKRGFSKKTTDVVYAADDVDLTVEAGQTVALVGESGSGKTTVARAILGLTRPTAGRIIFQGKDIHQLKGRERRQLLRDVQVVFQDPYSSLNPRMTVHDLVAEPLRAHERLNDKDLQHRVLGLLEMVGLGTQHLWRRSHEFSGGQCQRIAIARALALEPRLVVLDEPTSALDVSVQARILILLKELQERLGLAYLLIAHDLAVVESIADRVAVMYLGCIVASGSTPYLLHSPRHPYTQALLGSIPSPDPELRSQMKTVSGEVPTAIRPPSGCRFHPRCPLVMEACREVRPPLRMLSEDHWVACHLPDDTDLSRIRFDAPPVDEDASSA